MKNDNKNPAVPFFARYLDEQDYPRVQSDVKAGSRLVTAKAPSDIDEMITMKYPSDGDDDVVITQ
jgi:hypothetical protein